MIPKILHLCWFGKNEYPPLVKMCVESWEKYLPDYKIMIWNENTFDVNSVAWTKRAYELKKWAFVADYVRLFALYNYGGVYLDTDVEVLKDFNEVIKSGDLVLSRIEGGLVSCGFIACRPKNYDIANLLSFYEKPFKDDGNFLMNPLLFSIYFYKKYNCPVGYNLFTNDGIYIYPLDVLMPYRKDFYGKGMNKYSHSKYIIKKECCCIHHDLGSWGIKKPLITFLKNLFRFCLPSKLYLFIKSKKMKKAVMNLIKANEFIFDR